MRPLNKRGHPNPVAHAAGRGPNKYLALFKLLRKPPTQLRACQWRWRSAYDYNRITKNAYGSKDALLFFLMAVCMERERESHVACWPDDKVNA